MLCLVGATNRRFWYSSAQAMSIDVASDHVGNRYMTCAMSCSYSMHRQLTVIWIALMLPFAFGVSPNRGRSKCVNSSCLGSAARRSLASSIAGRLPTSNTWQPTKISSRIVTPPSRTCRLSYSTCSSQLKPGSRLRAHLCGHTASGFVICTAAPQPSPVPLRPATLIAFMSTSWVCLASRGLRLYALCVRHTPLVRHAQPPASMSPG